MYQMYRCVSLSSETRLLISPKQLHANQTESVSDGAINQSAVFLYFMFSLFLKDPFFQIIYWLSGETFFRHWQKVQNQIR